MSVDEPSRVPLENIYNIFPAAMLEVPKINLDFRIESVNSAQRFVFAPGCFLNTPAARTTRLTISVDVFDIETAFIVSYKELWYGLAKPSAQVNVVVTGDLSDFCVYRASKVRFLSDGHALPQRSPEAAFNTIAKYRRTLELVRPVID